MKNAIGINIIFERENKSNGVIYIASSPDINVFAESSSIEKAREKFIDGVKHHIETFPEVKEILIEKKSDKLEMPMIQKIFL